MSPTVTTVVPSDGSATIYLSNLNQVYAYIIVRSNEQIAYPIINCYTFIQATSDFTMSLEGFSDKGELFTLVTNTMPIVEGGSSLKLDDGLGGFIILDSHTSTATQITDAGFRTLIEGVAEPTTNQISVTAGQWFVTAHQINGSNIPTSASVIIGVPKSDGTCFVGSTMVTMADGSLKRIDEIKRGDVVLENADTGKTNIVANMYNAVINAVGYKIPKGLIGNTDDIICTNHPIVCNDGKNRIYPSDIPGVLSEKMCASIYDIQFEDEGTFYANGIMVDSLSPHNEYTNLSQKLYYNPEKYVKRIVVKEDDPIRNKPPMTTQFVNAVGA